MAAFDLVPDALVPFIENAPLLKGESYQAYMEFLTRVITDLEPAEMVEAISLIQYANVEWESLRCQRHRAYLIDLNWRAALAKVVATANPQMNSSDISREVELCEQDPARLARFGTRPEAVMAMASVIAGSELTYLDKRLDHLQRASKSIIQTFETRREIYTHRDRNRERWNEEREQARAREEFRTNKFISNQDFNRKRDQQFEQRRLRKEELQKEQRHFVDHLMASRSNEPPINSHESQNSDDLPKSKSPKLKSPKSESPKSAQKNGHHLGDILACPPNTKEGSTPVNTDSQQTSAATPTP